MKYRHRIFVEMIQYFSSNLDEVQSGLFNIIINKLYAYKFINIIFG